MHGHAWGTEDSFFNNNKLHAGRDAVERENKGGILELTQQEVMKRSHKILHRKASGGFGWYV